MNVIRPRSALFKRSLQIFCVFAFFSLLLFGLPRDETFREYLVKSETAAANEPGRTYEAALVIASQKKDNTAWLQHQFQAWRKSIYVVDDRKAHLTVPQNKGRESMVYLSYIVDNYETLENVTVFAHAERFQWHNDDPDYDGQRNLARLNISHVRDQGYTSLRCAWNIGCPEEIHPWTDVGKVTDPPQAGGVYKKIFEELFPGVEVPQVVASACCAQFAVSKEAIMARPKADYVRYRQWILDTNVHDDLSGRFLEYAWHIIFGKEAVFCPNARYCYCNLYGLCDLQCVDERSCKGRYDLPPFSTLPEGWPEIGWEGEERQLQEY